MEEAKNALKSTDDALSAAEKSLQNLKKVEANALAAQKMVEGKARDVEKKAQESEGVILNLRKEMGKMKAASAKVQKEWDEAQQATHAITQLVVYFSKGILQNSLDQFRCLNPDLLFDPKIVTVDLA